MVEANGGEIIEKVEVWVLHPSRTVFVTDFPGPPAEVCGYVSEEARAAAMERGYATVSEIGFPAECYLGSFPVRENGWNEAQTVAKAKATELGYEVKVSSCWDSYDGEDDDGYELEYDDDGWLDWEEEGDDGA